MIHLYSELHNNIVQITPLQATTTTVVSERLSKICIFLRLLSTDIGVQMNGVKVKSHSKIKLQ